MKRSLILSSLLVLALAVALPGLASDHAAQSPAEVEAVTNSGPACPQATPMPGVEAEGLLLPRPVPQWCPFNAPCPGGFCLDYPDCPEPTCIAGRCVYG